MFSRLKRAGKQYQVHKYAKNPDRNPGKKVITGICDADMTKAASTARSSPPKSNVPKLSNNNCRILVKRPVMTAKNPRRAVLQKPRGTLPHPNKLRPAVPPGGTGTYGIDRSPIPVDKKPQHVPLGRGQHL